MAYQREEDMIGYDECMAVESCRYWILQCRFGKHTEARPQNAAAKCIDKQKAAEQAKIEREKEKEMEKKKAKEKEIERKKKKEIEKKKAKEKAKIASRIRTNKQMIERCKLYGVMLTDAQCEALEKGALQKEVLTAEQRKAYRSAGHKHGIR